jgi:Ca2+-binding EF-hand superfamily protein
MSFQTTEIIKLINPDIKKKELNEIMNVINTDKKSMKRQELINKCKELKIKNITKKNKNELIKILETYEKKTDDTLLYGIKEKIKNPMEELVVELHNLIRKDIILIKKV